MRHVREGDLLASVRIPELNAFRDAARYLCVEMAAAGTEREKVLKCNDDLLRIRAWCRKDAFLLAKLVGMAVESMRLEALCFPLAAGTLTDDDLIRLPGQGEEWSSALAEAVADEATGFLDCCTYVRSAAERVRFQNNSGFRCYCGAVFRWSIRSGPGGIFCSA